MIMKTTVRSIQLFLSMFSLVIICACSGTKSMASLSHEGPVKVVDNGYQIVPAHHANQSNIMVHPNKDQPTHLSLTDMMRRLPGVRVQSGRGPYARVVVDGPTSFMAQTDPLFVVNGIVIGNVFSNVYTMVSPNNVISVSVLKGPDAAIYGLRGSSGVILIRTQ